MQTGKIGRIERMATDVDNRTSKARNWAVFAILILASIGLIASSIYQYQAVGILKSLFEPIWQWSPIAGTLLGYLLFCVIVTASYWRQKQAEWFVTNLFGVTAAYAAGIALSADLGELRWVAVAVLVGFASYLMVFSRRLRRKKAN